jgi:enoyl-CoA hydratase
MTDQTELVLIERQTELRTALVRLNRPKQLNALNGAVMDALCAALEELDREEAVRAIVVTGNERAFAAGADIGEMAEATPIDLLLTNRIGQWDRIRRITKPVIAAVNGWAVAAGLENALLADIRIAAENAVFGALERRWNIVGGDGMTVRLPLVVGYGRAMEMIITGRPVDAEEALRIGLANEVVPEGKALERALELAHQIAELPQGAIRSDKETMVRNVGRTYEEQLRQEAENTLSMFARKDSHAIGARAFKEGRTPEWPHRGL